MSVHADKTEENKTQAAANQTSGQRNTRGTTEFIDNRPAAHAQRQQQDLINNSPRVRQGADMQARIAQSPQAQQTAQLQALTTPEPAPQAVQQPKNDTGLPDNLKAGVENLSGYSLDDVKVHYNSDKPAQMQAHAYAQGTDIHVAPGQEQHLPHEAWHVVQQKQGRVKATRQLKGGVNVNDNAGLEKEADVMGRKAGQSINANDTRGTPSRASAPIYQREIAAFPLPAQRIGADELRGRSIEMEQLAEAAPESGVNLWAATNPRLPAMIYLLGTAHGLKLSEMGVNAAAREYLIDFLRTEAFTHVFTEMATQLPGTQHVPNLAAQLELKRKAVQALESFPKGGPPVSERARYIAYHKALSEVSKVESGLGGNDLQLDDAYLNLAQRPRTGAAVGPKVGALEDSTRRTLAHETNIRDMDLEPHDPTYRLGYAPDEPISGSKDVVSGNQKALFTEATAEAREGRDIANVEQRNKQWMKHVAPDNVKPGDKQVWIIGAAHLAGLVLRFQNIGWTVVHQTPPVVEPQ